MATATYRRRNIVFALYIGSRPSNSVYLYLHLYLSYCWHGGGDLNDALLYLSSNINKSPKIWVIWSIWYSALTEILKLIITELVGLPEVLTSVSTISYITFACLAFLRRNHHCFQFSGPRTLTGSEQSTQAFQCAVLQKTCSFKWICAVVQSYLCSS